MNALLKAGSGELSKFTKELEESKGTAESMAEIMELSLD
jgi:hypothetical protein